MQLSKLSKAIEETDLVNPDRGVNNWSHTTFSAIYIVPELKIATAAREAYLGLSELVRFTSLSFYSETKVLICH